MDSYVILRVLSLNIYDKKMIKNKNCNIYYLTYACFERLKYNALFRLLLNLS